MHCGSFHIMFDWNRSKLEMLAKIYPMHFSLMFYNHQLTLMFANLLPNPNTAQQNTQSSSPFLDMDLLSKAVAKIIKFDPEKESYNKTYVKADHFQKFYHQTALDRYADVITKRYGGSKDPISIVDLCCGYGRPTLALRERLEKSGVKVERIVGYDVSEDMIRFANLNNTFQTQVHFERKNIETEYNNVEEFDVAICLFGLQQINDFDATYNAISRSLKPGGIFLALAPLGLPQLFDARLNFIKQSKWSALFDTSSQIIYPFPTKLQEYANPLLNHFNHIKSQQRLVKVKFTRQEFILYLQSWFQELRLITNDVSNELKKDAIAKAYLGDFVDSIQSKGNEGNMTINEDGSVVLRHRTVHIAGEKP